MNESEARGTELFLRSGHAIREGEDIYWEFVTTGDDDARPVVVLSHGAGGSHAVWYQQVPELGRHFRVLTWDSRGFGNSTNRNDEPGPEAAAGDLAAVLDAVAVSSAHLVGQSMGGWHISAFAKAYPERVTSLVYADTVGGLWTPDLRTAFAEFAKAGGLAGRDPRPIGTHAALWSGTGEHDRAHAFLYEQLGSFHSPPMDRVGATIQWGLDHQEIAALGVPVLFVAGTHDAIFPSTLLAASCALIPGAAYVEIADTGHSPYFERPGDWNRAVLDFLRSV